MVEPVSNTKSMSTARATQMDWTCRKKTLALVLVINACFVFAYIRFQEHFPEGIKSEEKIGISQLVTPEMRLKALCESIKTPNTQEMTSTVLSKAHATESGSGRIVMHIETFSLKNISKQNGNDIIFVFAKQIKGDGRVSGYVIDHKNGSYTGMIQVFWTGRTHVYIKLGSTIENTCLRIKALQKYGNIVYTLKEPYGLRAGFVMNGTTELTPCNTNDFIYGSFSVCNFTTLNGGMSWFCGSPTKDSLTCAELRFFSLGPFNRTVDIVSSNYKIQRLGHGLFKKKLTTSVKSVSARNTSITCSEMNPTETWNSPSPTGYYLKKRWVLTSCRTSLKHTIASYRSCLRNKVLIMLGDSTVRQYVQFFLKSVLNLETKIGRGLTFGPNFTAYHGHNTFVNYGITVIYRKQAMPLHFSGHNIPISNILSFSQILDSFATNNMPGSSIILLLNYHTHFSAFPPERYRGRLEQLAKAIKRFLEKKPLAKVFFKGPSVCISNSKWWDTRISLLFEEILKEVFAEIMDRVVYLNVWDIAVAHNVQDVHPQGNALMSQLQQFMSFIC